MKKLGLLLLTLTICFFTACHKSIWEELENLDQRVTKLEELCKEMNTNITSLQTIVSVLQSNDYITGIIEIKKNGEVIGYTITFGKHDPITIYHGQDGKDGQDGANGSSSTPVIGVAQDTDGVYYWTLNGEWLLDDNGNKLPVSGKGDMPMLKIEEGYWYVSYDNGTTWTQLGKAVGDNGEKGEDGDSMFQSVTQDENYVYFTLADGTVIKITKSNSINDQPSGEDIIDFKDLVVKGLLLKLDIDTSHDGEISYDEAAAYTGEIRFSDNNNVYSFKEYQYFTGQKTITYGSFGGCANLFEIVLPSSIEFIDYAAFQSSISLKSIIIPESVTSIGSAAFNGCTNLKYITIPEHLNDIGSSAFQGTAWLNDQPDGLVYINQLLYTYKGEIPANTSVKIKDGIEYIMRGIFYNKANITSITLPSSIVSIGENAFINCSSLTTIICYAEQVPNLGKEVFDNTYYRISHKIKLYVPKASLLDYQTADQWKNMGEILPVE